MACSIYYIIYLYLCIILLQDLGLVSPRFVLPHTVSVCMACGLQFDTPKRKKHCAACGMVCLHILKYKLEYIGPSF